MDATGLIRSITNAVSRILRLMAESGDNGDETHESCNAPTGGVLNYRTARLDDGTDPFGWYEED